MQSKSKIRVIIIEDEAAIAFELRQFLKGAGFDVVGLAGSNAKALSMLEKHGCDVAVVDWQLKTETSEETLFYLRQHNTPFVLITGYNEQQVATNLGNAIRISKPIDPAELIKALMSVLR